MVNALLIATELITVHVSWRFIELGCYLLTALDIDPGKRLTFLLLHSIHSCLLSFQRSVFPCILGCFHIFDTVGRGKTYPLMNVSLSLFILFFILFITHFCLLAFMWSLFLLFFSFFVCVLYVTLSVKEKLSVNGESLLISIHILFFFHRCCQLLLRLLFLSLT